MNAHRAGRLDEAERGYRAMLRTDAGNFSALHMLGYLEGQRGRLDRALPLLEHAVERNPGHAGALGHYGHALTLAGRKTEALAIYDRLLTMQPDAVDVLYNRAVILTEMGRGADALAALDRAAALAPQTAVIFYGRGVVMTQLGRPADALANYDRALALDPALDLARGNRAMAALNACAFERYDAIAEEMRTLAAGGTAIAPLALQGFSEDKVLLRRGAEAMVRSQIPTRPAPLWCGEHYGHDRIRIGYVSHDFREHAVAHQLAPLIQAHDRARFEVIGISTSPDDGSAVRARLMASFDQFHDLAGQDHAAVARRLRALEIDIGVDLGGHTGGNALPVFSHRPAPVAVSWLGYPGTTGADFIDHLIADETVAPPEDQVFYSETLVHLPGSFFPTDPTCPIGTTPSRADEGLPQTGFVFASFNNGWKNTPAMFAIWMRLLAAVPGSILWLKESSDGAHRNLKAQAAAHGVEPARLVFAKDAPLDVHLARHTLADLGLDTLPYNGHATTAHALWAGLPVVTCRGAAFAGRVAASLLGAVGMPELVTGNLADYEALALTLARKPDMLAALRAKLATNCATAPLFDTDRFRRNIEAAYLDMLTAR